LRVNAEPPQSFSAGFELAGTPGEGELTLYTPIGTILAVLHWNPQSAELRAQGEVQKFDSLDALAFHATGTALPVRTLFDWLSGREADAPGWKADLSQFGMGRVIARRALPLPSAELTLLLDQ
jgi:outer membrane lipoprotein LolB